MKRNNFIASILAVVATPLLSIAQAAKTFLRTDKGFKIAAGEGRIHGHIKLKGVNANVLDVKISGSDTDGGLAIFENNSVTQGKGTPLHVHPTQDEVFYIIEGAFRFKVGDDLHDLKAGDSIFLPRNVPHAWTQVAEKGRMIVTFQPAGKIEEFFVSVAALTHEPTQEEMAKLFLDHEMKIVGPPLKLG